MRGKDQCKFWQTSEAARNRLFQKIGAQIAAICKDIVAMLIKDREMGVKSVSGKILVRFCHETCRHIVVPRQPMHQHLEQPGIVSRPQSIWHMAQVDFKLAFTTFGNRGLCRNAHSLAGLVEFIEKDIKCIKCAERQDMRPVASFT